MIAVEPRLGAALLLAALFAVVLGLLWLGWRAKRRAQAEVPAPLPLDEAAFGAPEMAWDDVHYVATTPFDAPLERIIVHGLAFRGRCRLELGAPGLAVRLAGREPFLIPRSSIAAIERGTATIDRVVEPGGLSVVRWSLAEHTGARRLVDTSFRIVDPAARADFHARLEVRVDTPATAPEELP